MPASCRRRSARRGKRGEGARERVGGRLAAKGADESEAEVVLDVEGREDRTPLGRMGDSEAHELPGRKTGDVLAEKKMRPLVTGTSPVATRAIVDFPAPFGPTRAVTEPAATDNDTPNKARKRP